MDEWRGGDLYDVRIDGDDVTMKFADGTTTHSRIPARERFEVMMTSMRSRENGRPLKGEGGILRGRLNESSNPEWITAPAMKYVGLYKAPSKPPPKNGHVQRCGVLVVSTQLDYRDGRLAEPGRTAANRHGCQNRAAPGLDVCHRHAEQRAWEECELWMMRCEAVRLSQPPTLPPS